MDFTKQSNRTAMEIFCEVSFYYTFSLTLQHVFSVAFTHIHTHILNTKQTCIQSITHAWMHTTHHVCIIYQQPPLGLRHSKNICTNLSAAASWPAPLSRCGSSLAPHALCLAERWLSTCLSGHLSAHTHTPKNIIIINININLVSHIQNM